MLKRLIQTPHIKLLFITVIALLLNACGGSDAGGNTASVQSATGSTANVADVADDHTLAGSVGDGPVTGATVEIWSAQGHLIDTAMSDNTASFHSRIRIRRSDYPLLLKVRGGIDLVTGSEPDFQMLSVMPDRHTTQVNINPFSTLIVMIAQSLPGGMTADTISSAQGVVKNMLGFGLDPGVIADPIRSHLTDANVASLIKSSEAMGEMIRRTRDQIAASGRQIDGDAVLLALAADLQDGRLDGLGASGSDPWISAVARVVSGQVLVEALANSLKVGGIIATPVIDQAIATTRPGIDSGNMTQDVLITAGMLQQTQTALAAARLLDSSAEVIALEAAVSTLSAGTRSTDIANVLPADASRSLDNAVLLSSTADATQLAAVNAIGEHTGSASQTPAVPDTTAPATEDPVTTTETSRRFGSRWRTWSSAPGTADPGTTDPGTADPGTSNPGTTEPGTNDPGTTDPGTTDPGTVDPGTTDPGTTDPGTVDPGTSDPGTVDPGTSDPGTVDPGTSDPGTVDPGTTDPGTSDPGTAGPVSSPAVNTPPVIGGSPAGTVTAGSAYSFQPVASDPDGDTLKFSITGKPAWAGFDTATGRLSGTPGDSDAGTYSSIAIAVSDGSHTTALQAFTIRVDPAQNPPGGFTLSWTAPVARSDGTPLSLADIGGFRIHYGTVTGNYPDTIDVSDGSTHSATVNNLPAGTYYVVMTTYDSNGVESAYSAEVVKVAQ